MDELLEVETLKNQWGSFSTSLEFNNINPVFLHKIAKGESKKNAELEFI